MWKYIVPSKILKDVGLWLYPPHQLLQVRFGHCIVYIAFVLFHEASYLFLDLFFFIAYVCKCAFLCLCRCVCRGRGVCTHVHVHACGGLRTTSDKISSSWRLFLSFEVGALSGLKLTNWAKLAGQQAPGCLLASICWGEAWDYRPRNYLCFEDRTHIFMLMKQAVYQLSHPTIPYLSFQRVLWVQMIFSLLRVLSG